MANYAENNIKDILNKYIQYLDKNEIEYPVSGLDYSSLYPSLIMTYNLSPEYLVTDENYMLELKNKDYDIHNIEFEYNYKDYLSNDKSKIIKAWTIRHDESNKQNSMFGLYPSILRDLFKQRSEMKKELAVYKDKKEHIEKYETDYEDTVEYKECIFKLNYCDTKQKALKVFMNTFYGEMGNKNSPLFQLPLAGGVTSSGQRNLLLIKDYVEPLGHKVYYGDSVIGETPILIKSNNKISLIKIEDFKWKELPIIKSGTKEIILEESVDTLLGNLKYINTEVYTENGWTEVKKIIRHKTTKKIYRITTTHGCIVATEDHSLLDKNKYKITPSKCNINTELLHWNFSNKSNNESNNELDSEYCDFDLEYDLLHNDEYYLKFRKLYFTTQMKAQNFYLKFTQLGYYVKLETTLSAYVLTICKKNSIEHNISKIRKFQINKIEYLGITNDYVYDIETESHHFAAGIGQLVVHNTDSLYISCPSKYYKELDKQYYTNEITKEEYNTELVLKTFIAIDDIKNKVNDYLYRDNGTKYLKMSYEEVLYPLAFLSKKKYYGIPHENIPNFKPKDLFIRGLEVKKRGVSEILKIVCLELMWESMNLKNTKTLKQLVIEKIKELFAKKWNLHDFIQTGVWKPEKSNITLNSFAERMKEENKQIPTPGERFNYVIIKRYPYKYDYKGRKIPLKKADKMEYLDIVEKNNYEIDLKYYFDKQLTGQFARLISYDSQFEVYVNNELDDDKTYNNCQKFILTLADQHNNSYIDRNKVFKTMYKEIKNKYKTKVNQNNIYDNKFNIIFNLNKKNQEDIDIYNLIKENILTLIKSNNEIQVIVNNFIKKNKLKELQLFYNKKNNSLFTLQTNYLQQEFHSELEDIIRIIQNNNLQNTIFNLDDINIINIIEYLRKKYEIEKIRDIHNKENINDIYDIINEDELDYELDNKDLYKNIDLDILNAIYNKYIKLISIQKNILMQENIFNTVYHKINSNSKYIEKPIGFKL